MLSLHRLGDDVTQRRASCRLHLWHRWVRVHVERHSYVSASVPATRRRTIFDPRALTRRPRTSGLPAGPRRRRRWNGREPTPKEMP